MHCVRIDETKTNWFSVGSWEEKSQVIFFSGRGSRYVLVNTGSRPPSPFSTSQKGNQKKYLFLFIFDV